MATMMMMVVAEVDEGGHGSGDDVDHFGDDSGGDDWKTFSLKKVSM